MQKENDVSTSALSEKQLIEAAKKNPEEFKHLFHKYYNTIFNYSLRRTGDAHLAEDIAANTFHIALQNIKKYQWKGISLSAWLYRIAINEINQNHRKHKKEIPLTTEIQALIKDERSSDDALIEAEELVAQNIQFKKMHNVLAGMKLKYQNVLTLRYFEEKSYREISDILELPENTVKTHIRRGLIQLKEQL